MAGGPDLTPAPLLADPAALGALNPVPFALVLASSSPRRLALLAQIGITPAAVIAPEIDETPARSEPPRLYALRMARAKAAAVPVPGFFSLAADTVVAVGRRILPKAETLPEARACIGLLSGRRHRVLTAVVLTAPDGRRAERLSETIVTFSRLTEAQKSAWLALGEWEGKAGGYAINGAAASFVRFLSGSFSGVVGLPLFETAQMLRGFGWPVPGVEGLGPNPDAAEPDGGTPEVTVQAAQQPPVAGPDRPRGRARDHPGPPGSGPKGPGPKGEGSATGAVGQPVAPRVPVGLEPHSAESGPARPVPVVPDHFESGEP